MTTIGYARVSTEEQNIDLQRFALKAARCNKIFVDDGVSAVAKKRPAFEAALAELRPGDTFVVWKLDRAFRSLRQALDTLDRFHASDIVFRSLTEHIDTSTPMGEAMYHIQNVFAQLERRLISERTKAGMEAARRRGSKIGRPRRLTKEKLRRMHALLREGKSRRYIASRLRVSKRTISRAICCG